MTCGRQDSASLARFVHGRRIGRLRLQLVLANRHDENDGHGVLQLLGLRLGKATRLAVPSSTVQEEAFQVGSILRRSRRLLVVHDLVVEREQVNGYGVLAGKVLLDAGQEGLREEETRDPESARRTILVPILNENNTVAMRITNSQSHMTRTYIEELESGQKVVNVAAQRLERGIRLLLPHGRYLSLHQAEIDLFQLGAHDHETFDGLLDVDERGADDGEESIETGHLLDKHGVHALLVLGRIASQGRLRVEVLGQLGENVRGDAGDYIVRRLSVS